MQAHDVSASASAATSHLVEDRPCFGEALGGEVEVGVRVRGGHLGADARLPRGTTGIGEATA